MNMPEKKKFEDLTPKDLKELKIEFAPGCFDNFDGSQEELDELIAEITQMIRSGEIHEKSREVDIDEMIEEDPELAEKIFASLVEEQPKRNLQ